MGAEGSLGGLLSTETTMSNISQSRAVRHKSCSTWIDGRYQSDGSLDGMVYMPTCYVSFSFCPLLRLAMAHEQVELAVGATPKPLYSMWARFNYGGQTMYAEWRYDGKTPTKRSAGRRVAKWARQLIAAIDKEINQQ